MARIAGRKGSLVQRSTPRSPRALHEAAWPDMFANLQSAYVELTRARFEGERQAAEMAEARDLFQQVVESMSEALFLLDEAGLVARANPAAAALLGRPDADLVGQPFSALCGSDLIPATAWQLLERSPDGALRNLEVELAAGTGRVVPINVSCALVRDKRGKIVGMLIVARDITERKQAEDRLRFLAEASQSLASSLEYEATLETVARLAVPFLADWCSVYTSGEDGQIRRAALAFADPAVAACAEALKRYPPTANLATSRVALTLRTGQSDLRPEIPPGYVEAIAYDAEHLALLRQLDFRSSLVVPLRARERVLGAVGLFAGRSGRRFGPTDLALAEELARRAALALDNALLYREAQEAIRARDEFLSIASHELRTPVTGIKGNAQILLRWYQSGRLGEDRLARQLQAIDRASSRLASLTEDLLDVARIRTGRVALRPQPIDLAALVREIVGRHEDQLDDRHRLVLAGDAVACPIVADPSRIEQVLGNLIENAVKYSPGGGDIRVSIRPDGEGVLLEVSDRGIGLPAGAAERIFEPFGRAANASERHLPGMGLGLYICRDIVARHGGRIWAESPGVDLGTTMRLWLPTRGAAPEADGE